MKEGEEIFCIDKESASFPEVLKEIVDAPKKIYVRGDYSILHRLCFAVVGSREISEYGKQVIQKIIPPLAREFVIVSGMALGSDSVAHSAAVAAGRPTIAVLGCGVDSASVYPTAHADLQTRIIAGGGCMVSEYPSGTRARPEYFPARNRIVAGLSSGVLITEAAKDSGTMITARLALDYGRDVFVVPGSIFSRLSAGVHWLLKQGATPITEAQDVFDMYGINPSQISNSLGAQLTTEEHLIVSALEGAAMRIQDIQALTKSSTQKTLEVLTKLELSGQIKNVSGLFRINQSS